ncbi:MAG: 5-methyltetrahydropteroyltriglutamate--homocysteine S-methyltransferase [Fimbriimonadales bacterium]|nr:MAG: 5-methyltetrahydropteroyltriglutamate--homocysteine methyltransferase [Fimbriimonadales bacterium]
MQTYAYGYPRLGASREFKRLIEGYWQGKVSEAELRAGIDALERQRIALYQQFVDAHPVGEMTLYDNMLDTAIMLGVYPIDPRDLNAYFTLARGADALPMTKWFNTNYHYLVSHIDAQTAFRLHWNKPLEAFQHYGGGYPYLIGPYTFLRLSRGFEPEQLPALLERLTPVYAEILQQLKQAGAAYVHLDEPAFALDATEAEIDAIRAAYQTLGQYAPILLFSYYDSVDFLPRLYDLPVAGFGLDFVHGARNYQILQQHGFPSDKILIAGVVDGRNVWKTDLRAAAERARALAQQTGATVWLSNAAPLMHLPVSVEPESALDPALRERIAFATERLQELRLLKTLLTEGETDATRAWNAYQHASDHWYAPGVQSRVASLTPADFERAAPYAERDRIQRERLQLPLFPTTTIGSFPQTPEVRQMRQAYRTGKITADEYDAYIQQQIRELIAFQEQQGLDVLVHGEFERTDMVEFFAEKMDGIAFTQQGWLLSYGTRVYRPPIIYGDVARTAPMTVKETAYAQSLTRKPVKGMLTGPVTIIAWSYVREDIPVEQVAYQIALALQDEVRDLEAAGIPIVQIDEPAYREKAPLKRADWDAYFRWAAQAFKLASRAKPETQIHTHMCYSDFNTVLRYIDWMDADVITIEAARAKGEVIGAFEHYNYPRQIGPGVFDVHTPAVPSVESIEAVMARAIRVFPREQFWVNPDCGLKTRKWEEVIPALQHMVEAARRLRAHTG